MSSKEEWAKEQFEEARIKIPVGKAVLKLLEVWKTIGLNEPDSKQTVEVFSKLAFGHALVEENPNEVWVPARPGQISIGDVVRVAHNAFSDDVGMIHNGRRGLIVAIRSGDVIFKSTDDRTPALDGTHFTPSKLEKRIQ